MKIKTATATVEISQYYHERRTYKGDQVDTIKVMLPGKLTEVELTALTGGSLTVLDDQEAIAEEITGHTIAIEHSLVLMKPPISQAEAEDMRAALDSLGVTKEGTWSDGAAKIRAMGTTEKISQLPK